MTIYPVSCPLPAVGIFSFLKYHQFASAGLEEERGRPLKTDLHLSQQIKQTLWHALELQELAPAQLFAGTGSVKRAMLMEAMQEITSQVPARSVTFVNYKKTQWLIGSGPGVQQKRRKDK